MSWCRARLLMSLFSITLAVMEGSAGAARLQSGSGRRPGAASDTRIVSPTVVASWMSYQDDVTENPTTLLVLWRGTPGWFVRGPAKRDSGAGMRWSRGGTGNQIGYLNMSMGGLAFGMEFDRAKKNVKILNEEISLKEANVVLVDFVDGLNGPTIVSRRWINPPSRSDSAQDPIVDIIKRTPDLFEYLLCDSSLSDSATNVGVRASCERMRP